MVLNKEISYQRVKRIGLFFMRGLEVIGISLFSEIETHYKPVQSESEFEQKVMRLAEATNDAVIGDRIGVTS